MSDKPDKPLPFVVTDRRRFNAEGDVRPDAPPLPPAESQPAEPEPAPMATASDPAAADDNAANPAPLASTDDAPAGTAADAFADEAGMPPVPTEDQMEQSRLAYEATADRLETAVRAANPGADHPPAMSFEQVVQSVYMQAILQLGGGTQEGQQPQVDILGAKQSIDMLGILRAKTAGNLDATEERLLASAVFELRLAFLEITQALARSAQQRATQAGVPPPPGGRPGPSIVR